MRRLAYLFMVVCLVAACGVGVGDGPNPDDIAGRYEGIPKSDGYIHQTIDLSNFTDEALLPVISYIPVDSEGNELGEVVVTTVFGSDRGMLIVPPTGFYDILRFSGDREHDVADVRIRVESVVSVGRFPYDGSDSVQVGSATGEPLEKFDAFETVTLTNPSPVIITLRVVCILWQPEVPGQSQQADQVDEVLAKVIVPAGADVTTKVSDSFSRRVKRYGFGCDSLKAHPVGSR